MASGDNIDVFRTHFLQHKADFRELAGIHDTASFM